jgi:hypothetical protein
VKPARYPIEEILWLDSTQLEGGSWMDVDAARKMMDDLLQRTVGFLVAESTTSVTVARSISEWSDPDTVEKVEGVLVIPKRAIMERRTLRQKRD